MGEIDFYLKNGEIPIFPTLTKRLDCAKEHLIGLWEYKGQKGIFQARKHLAWYCKGFIGAGELRDQCSHISSVEEGINLIDSALLKIKPKV